MQEKNLLLLKWKSTLILNIIMKMMLECLQKKLKKLKEKLKDTVISGVKGIEQILVVKKARDYIAMTLGTNLREILPMKEVNKDKTISNDLYEVAEVFGIE